MLILFAHVVHWAETFLYFAPIVAMVGAVLWARYRAPQSAEAESEQS